MDSNSTFGTFVSNHVNEVKALIYSAFLFLNIDPEVVNILMWLMLFDTLFGIFKALKLGEHFNFKVLFFGLCTKCLVLLLPMTLALVAKGVNNAWDFTSLVDAVLRLLVVAEGLSIITSMYVIKTGVRVKNFDIFTLLLSSIRKGLQSIITSLLKKIENPVEDDQNNTEHEQ